MICCPEIIPKLFQNFAFKFFLRAKNTIVRSFTLSKVYFIAFNSNYSMNSITVLSIITCYLLDFMANKSV